MGFVGPEMVLNDSFHKFVVENRNFQNNIITAVVDEAHNISEWGTDDFRPEFSRISALLARLPQGLPILAASATVSPEVIVDIKNKLGMGGHCDHIAVSNEKLNVSLSVRMLQHPPDSYADLLALFPKNPISPDDFEQTLIYVNSRQEAERIQDFLRAHAPEQIPGVRFEFYHRYIADDRKATIEKGLASGFLRGVPATDALGMVWFFLILTVYQVTDLEGTGHGLSVHQAYLLLDATTDIQFSYSKDWTLCSCVH